MRQLGFDSCRSYCERCRWLQGITRKFSIVIIFVSCEEETVIRVDSSGLTVSRIASTVAGYKVQLVTSTLLILSYNPHGS